MEAGDVIRSVNGVEIATSSDLPPRIGAMAPGTKVTLGILREGKPRDVTVTLSTLEEDADTAASTAQQDGGSPTAPARAESALLGISVADLDAATRKQLGLKPGEGVRITRVYGESASETLQPGIVILQVGRKAVGSVAEFNQELRGVKAGQVVMLLVRSPRGGSAFVAVTAGDGG
jgi:serine protease Do